MVQLIVASTINDKGDTSTIEVIFWDLFIYTTTANIACLIAHAAYLI